MRSGGVEGSAAGRCSDPTAGEQDAGVAVAGLIGQEARLDAEVGRDRLEHPTQVGLVESSQGASRSAHG